MKKITTINAPKAIGPYNQGIISGNLVFCSGQIPINPETGMIDASIEKQVEQCCKNVQAILLAAGSSLDKVIKTTCFIADMDNFPTFNEIYSKYFISNPARSCCAVKTLPKNVLCEIEAIAEI